jgi:signal transduction histidine kinase
VALAIEAFGEELTAESVVGGLTPATFCVVTEGAPQMLHPIMRDEICRIAFETLRNAFRHAHARRIEVGITYGDQLLQIRVRDDGRGIDATTLDHGGRPGHWGLAGMRERALRIGARLDIRSRSGDGTEVELSVSTGAQTAWRVPGEGAARAPQ